MGGMWGWARQDLVQQREVGADCILRGDPSRKTLNINDKLLSQVNMPDLFTIEKKISSSVKCQIFSGNANGIGKG